MTIPLYDSRVPENPDDNLAKSQGELLSNFQSLFSQFGANHVSMNESGVGNHTNVQMIPRGADLQTNASDINVYTKSVEGQSGQLFLRFAGNGDPIQLTAYQIYEVPQTDDTKMYFTFLPGNVVVYFGYFNTYSSTKLVLTPPVCRNIITISFGSISSGPPNFLTKPSVSVIQPSEGFVESIEVKVGSAPSYFIILGEL